MKINSVFSLLFVALLSSCDYNELTDTENPVSSSIEDAKRSDFRVNMETARYAAKFLSEKEVKDIKPIVYRGKDTVLFVVNYDEGWKLLSADMRAKAVIASSQTGTFDAAGSNSGSALWINNLANQVLALKHDKTPVSYSELNKNEEYVFWHRMYLGYLAERRANAENSHNSRRRIPNNLYASASSGSNHKRFLCKELVSSKILGTTRQSLGNRLKTKWGQGSPWNVCLPFVFDEQGNATYPVVGCVGVAMGQIIYYSHFNLNMPTWLHHGAKLEGVYYDKKNYDIRFTTGQYVENSPRWNQMALRASYKQSPTDATNYVAELFAELDYKLSMDYGYLASGAHVSRDVINQYGLTWDEGGYNSQIVEQNLRNGLPVLITSYANEKTTGWWLWKKTQPVDGHAWVIDGLVEETTTIQNTYKWVVVELMERQDDTGYRDPEDRNGNNSNRGKCTELMPFEEAIVQARYTSMDELRGNYADVIDYDEAKRQNIVPGQRDVETSKTSYRRILMNWGWSGNGDDIEYQPSATTWYVSPYTFKYNTTIYYNLRKK